MPWMIRLAEVTPAGAGGGGVLLDAGVADHARRRVWMNGLPHPRPARWRPRRAADSRSLPTDTLDGESRPRGRVSPKGVNWVLQWAIEGESNILSSAGVQAWTG